MWSEMDECVALDVVEWEETLDCNLPYFMVYRKLYTL